MNKQLFNISPIIIKLKNNSYFICLILMVSIAFLSNSLAHATAVIGFNPGYIIDDSIFINNSSMSVQQIQDFLNSKVPACDTYGTQPSEFGGGTRAQWAAARGFSTPFTCLKDYSENGLTTAQIIYNVSQQYQINPQVLIVLLQKEQGLVTDTWPTSNQYRSATGYGCPDTAPCDSKYYGLTNQITWSGKMFHAIMTNSPTWYTSYILGNNYIQYSPDSLCGGSTVNIQNRATQALYNYTPYQPNQATLDAGWGSAPCGAYGNRNFYQYFINWFGTINYSKVPPLYKSSSANTIYTISGDNKYELTSFEIIKAYGLLSYQPVIVSDTFLSSFNTGTTISSTIAKKQNDISGILYMFDDGKRYPITIDACKTKPDGTSIINSSWKIDCFNSNTTLSLPNELIDNFTVQDINIPNVVIYDNSAWKVENGNRLRITDPIFVNLFGGWGVTREMQTINIPKAQGKILIPNESLVKFSDSPSIYLLVDAKLYKILSPEDIGYWRLGAKKIYIIPSSYNESDPLEISPEYLKQFVIDANGTQYILFPNGTKSILPANIGSLQPAQYSQIPDYIINEIPTVTMPQAFRADNGEIFTIQDNMRYIFPTIDDIVYSKIPIMNIQQVSNNIESTFNYGGMKMSNGRLFKVSGDDTIRYVYDKGESLAVYSVNIPYLPYDKIITVDSTTGANYPVVGIYK
ncbi:MAG: hypothetical protein WCH58_02580 [Candidatus Saccharibacteria bacterium]